MRWEKIKVGESRTLARERGIKAGERREKDGIHSDVCKMTEFVCKAPLVR